MMGSDAWGYPVYEAGYRQMVSDGQHGPCPSLPHQKYNKYHMTYEGLNKSAAKEQLYWPPNSGWSPTKTWYQSPSYEQYPHPKLEMGDSFFTSQGGNMDNKQPAASFDYLKIRDIKIEKKDDEYFKKPLPSFKNLSAAFKKNATRPIPRGSSEKHQIRSNMNGITKNSYQSMNPVADEAMDYTMGNPALNKLGTASFTHTPPPSPPYLQHPSIPTLVEDVHDKTYTTLQPRKTLPGFHDTQVSMSHVASTDMLSWERRHPNNWSPNEVMDFIYYLVQETTPHHIIPDFQEGHLFNKMTGKQLMEMSVADFMRCSPEHGQMFYEKFRDLCDKATFLHEPDMSEDDIMSPDSFMSSDYLLDESFDGEVSPSNSVRIQGFEYDFNIQEQFPDYLQPDESGYMSADSSASGCYSNIDEAEQCLPDLVPRDYHPPPTCATNLYPAKRGPGRPRKNQPDGQPRPPSQRGRKPGQTTKGNHLYEFIRDMLYDSNYNPSHVKWEDRENGVFRFVQSEKVASLWGSKKNNSRMTYEKLSRAMRFCRTVGYFDPLPRDRGFPKKLCFKFGHKAQNWQHYSRPTV